MKKFDFSGWATRNDIRCADGRVIRKDAFKNNDGRTVPLVWNHQHNDLENTLGHAILENRDEGVYAYCSFNESDRGQKAKLLVQHGDITALSIWANQLKQTGSDVIHGVIREVSLVLAGANPGAYIDSVLEHGIEGEEGAIIYTDENISLFHADDVETPKAKTLNVEVPKVKDFKHSDTKPDNEKTLKDVFDEMTEEQQQVCLAMVGMALEDDDDEEQEESDGTVKHNVFEMDLTNETQGNVISHSDMMAVINDAKRFGSMKESSIQHGITNIDYMFPDYQSLNTPPDFIQREMSWVRKVIGSVHHTPFSRIKSMFADITGEDARALGYVKGNLKKDEVFTLLKRTTDPQTVYKRQKLDRDDVIDITDFDVVAWLKSEMRMMLDEEIARAILVGDGRPAASDDKIRETNIRPIWTDADLYTIKADVAVPANATADEISKTFVRAAVKSRKNYKGSGSPTLFTTEDILTDMLLVEDSMGRVIYDSVEKLATALRVSSIVTVPVMENLTRERSGGVTVNLMGIIVNMADYNIGADKGGAVNMFDDFDIDYNQQKYLIETRISGALIRPYSAIALEKVVSSGGST